MSSETASVSTPEELAAVRHLVDLGYQDPLRTAALETAAERTRQDQVRRADELLRGGQSAEAIDLLEQAARNSPEWTAGRHWLARAYFRGGRLAETAALLDWLEVHGVEHAELSLMRATIALRRRRFDEAVDKAEYAKCLHAALPEADVILGEVAFRRGDDAMADAAYCRAIEQNPRSAAARIGLAAVALRAGAYEDALDWALQAIEDGPAKWQAHCHLGRALLQLGRLAEARFALERSASMSPKPAAPYRWLIRIHEQAGDDAAARAARERAREIIRTRRAAKKSPRVQ